VNDPWLEIKFYRRAVKQFRSNAACAKKFLAVCVLSNIRCDGLQVRTIERRWNARVAEKCHGGSY
jgi:hypothetical protein